MTIKFIKGQFMYKPEGIIFIEGPTEVSDVPVMSAPEKGWTVNVYFVSLIKITKPGQVVVYP